MASGDGNGSGVKVITTTLERVNLAARFESKQPVARSDESAFNCGYFNAIPGYKGEVAVAPDVIKLAPLSRIDAMISVHKAIYPDYEFDEESVARRHKQREHIEAAITAANLSKAKAQATWEKAQMAHTSKMYYLNRDKTLLTQLEEVDMNLTVLRKEKEETRKWTDSEALKQEKRRKLDEKRHERNARNEEEILAQDRRRRCAPRFSWQTDDQSDERAEGQPPLIHQHDFARAA